MWLFLVPNDGAEGGGDTCISDQSSSATYKHICGYLNNDTVQPLCVILPQMDGYIKYFDDGGKICHLLRMMKTFMKSIMKYGK